MISIREALPADALDVARAHVRSWQAGYGGLIAQEYLDKLRPEDRASRYAFGQMNPSGPFTQVAVDGDTICGHVTTGRARDDDLPACGEIWAIYVDPLRWGTGVGRRLMAAGCAHLSDEGHNTALLWVLSGNIRARRCYEGVGWRPDGAQRTGAIGDSLVHEIRYQRDVLNEETCLSHF